MTPCNEGFTPLPSDWRIEFVRPLYVGVWSHRPETFDLFNTLRAAEWAFRDALRYERTISRDVELWLYHTLADDTPAVVISAGRRGGIRVERINGLK